MVGSFRRRNDFGWAPIARRSLSPPLVRSRRSHPTFLPAWRKRLRNCGRSRPFDRLRAYESDLKACRTAGSADLNVLRSYKFRFFLRTVQEQVLAEFRDSECVIVMSLPYKTI